MTVLLIVSISIRLQYSVCVAATCAGYHVLMWLQSIDFHNLLFCTTEHMTQNFDMPSLKRTFFFKFVFRKVDINYNPQALYMKQQERHALFCALIL